MKYLLYIDEKKESDMLLGKQDSQSGRALNDINIDLLSQFSRAVSCRGNP